MRARVSDDAMAARAFNDGACLSLRTLETRAFSPCCTTLENKLFTLLAPLMLFFFPLSLLFYGVFSWVPVPHSCICAHLLLYIRFVFHV